ncbi:hypothetical protein GCM10014719_32300 [Planomonospora parontospora subsp. antibiotica]|nr:hypothetical protein GCM10014719_32300 [Planomonospora parontospora subsp. antibiotica]GII18029.1 hypothetical protein Ppa05_47550 [Planomonospora parontospora subsp. antibiotica]
MPGPLPQRARSRRPPAALITRVGIIGRRALGNGPAPATVSGRGPAAVAPDQVRRFLTFRETAVS